MKKVNLALNAKHIVGAWAESLGGSKKDLYMKLHPGVKKAFRIICRNHISRI